MARKKIDKPKPGTPEYFRMLGDKHMAQSRACERAGLYDDALICRERADAWYKQAERLER